MRSYWIGTASAVALVAAFAVGAPAQAQDEGAEDMQGESLVCEEGSTDAACQALDGSGQDAGTEGGEEGTVGTRTGDDTGDDTGAGGDETGAGGGETTGAGGDAGGASGGSDSDSGDGSGG